LHYSDKVTSLYIIAS